MRISLRISLIAGLMLPITVIAATQLQVEQTIAGLDAQVTMTDVPAGDLSLHVLLPSGDDARIPVKSVGGASQKTSIPGDELQEAGNYRAYLENIQGRLSGEATFTVLPDNVDGQVSQMESDTKTVPANGVSAATVTVTLRDGYGNLLSGRPVQLVGSRLEDKITPLSTTTNTLGMQQFSVTSTKPGTVFLRSLDLLSSTTLDARIEMEFTDQTQSGPTTGFNGDLSRYYGYSNPWAMPSPYYPGYPAPAYANPLAAQLTAAATSGNVQSFDITLNPRQPQARQSFTITIRAVGADGKTVQDYTGTVRITAPDDPNAVLPGLTQEGQGQAKFIPKNLGVKVMSLSTSFSTPGEHVLLLEDTTSVPGQTITGQVTVTVVGSAVTPGHMITFTAPTDGATVSNPRLQIQGKGPSLRNLTVTGGMTPVEGETDANGLFSIGVELDPSKTSHILHVQDDSTDPSQQSAGDLHLTLGAAADDITPPTFTASFSPASPMEGEDVTLTVKSDELNLNVAFALGSQNLSLTPDPLSPGNYTVLFRAPIAGKYSASIVATDAAGNPGIQSEDVIVQATDLPIVQNVSATPKVGGVELRWAPVRDDRITSFVVYVGTEPQNYTFTLDTTKVGTGASVLGLDSGRTYYFAVTAKADKRESAKSAVITSAPLGTGIIATPGAGSIQLTWTFPGDAISIEGFRLEYGTSPTDLTETRLLPAGARTMLVQDLIPGVAYTLRLTPLAETTGEALTDLAGSVTATPLFVDPLHPAAVDSNDFPPDNNLHSGAETTTGSGLPPLILWTCIIASAATIVLFARRRKTLRAEKVFITRAQEQYHR